MYEDRHYAVKMDLTRYEDIALKYIKDVPVETLSPKLVAVTNTKTLKLWNYYRHVISSEYQKEMVGPGRIHRYLFMDATTNAVLGVFALNDLPMEDPYLYAYLNWADKDVVTRNKAGGLLRRNSNQNRAINTVYLIRRCLPLFEFGDLTGGKGMVYAMLSKEVIRSMEVQYSFRLSCLTAKTVHGKSSQYNRIKEMEFLGVSDQGTGYYLAELRKYGVRYCRGEKDSLGATKVPTFKEQAEFWRERWFLPRCERLGVSTIRFDKERYSLSTLIARGLLPQDE